MPDFAITSLRGGQNDSDSPLALAPDQCVYVRNVEYRDSMLGERRRGTDAIDLTGAGLASKDAVVFLCRHTPTTDAEDAELWGLGLTGTASITLSRKTTTWSDVTVGDVPVLTGDYPYRWDAVSFGGRLFVAYKSSVNRLHVWDGTSFRRTGVAAPPAAPSVADTGSGAYAGERSFRVRFTRMSGSVVLNRSEPSTEVAFTPSGTGAGAQITRPATNAGEDETHWEVEESDGSGNWYRIATVAIGTTTYTDTITPVGTVPDNGVLSDDIGDNSLLESAEFLTVDENRLIFGGNYDDETQSARVGWTPTINDPAGVGNSERSPTDIDSYKDLDVYNGGRLTGLSLPVNGDIIVTKLRQIHKLVRTGERIDAYETVPITKSRGALRGSLVESVDQTGQPALYMLDPEVGPLRYGYGGLRRCGADIFRTWQTVNLDATKVVCWGMAYPRAEQVHWWIATGASNTPTLRLVLHTNLQRETEEGMRKGIAPWDGLSAQALCGCLFSDNVDDNTARSSVLVPFIGLTGNGLIHRTDTGADDNGTAYHATQTTRPYAPTQALHDMGVITATLVADAVADAVIDVQIDGNFGLVDRQIDTVDVSPEASETHVIRNLDNLSLSEIRTAQFTFSDPAEPGPRWALQLFALKSRTERTAAGI